MTFKIEKCSDHSNLVFRLSGRVEGHQLKELKGLIAQATPVAILDLQELKLVDRDVVVFLCLCEADGMELRNCPSYIREWILAENAASRDR